MTFNNNNNNQKQGTDIHYNKAGQAVNTESNTKGVADQSQPTGKVENKSSDNNNKSSNHNENKSHQHAKLGGGKHSFTHPRDFENADTKDNEQKVRCDCGELVPVSQINREDVNVAIKGQQSQNVDGSAGQGTTVVYDASRPKGQQNAKITVDDSSNPAIVYDNGIKSNENLYQHDKAISDAIGNEVTTTKVVKSKVDNPEINQANSNIPIDLEAGKHDPSDSKRKSSTKRD